MDSGSAVTAVSSTFYKGLMGAGAPVGELCPTNRRLRGANGSHILCGLVFRAPGGVPYFGV